MRCFLKALLQGAWKLKFRLVKPNNLMKVLFQENGSDFQRMFLQMNLMHILTFNSLNFNVQYGYWSVIINHTTLKKVLSQLFLSTHYCYSQ